MLLVENTSCPSLLEDHMRHNTLVGKATYQITGEIFILTNVVEYRFMLRMPAATTCVTCANCLGTMLRSVQGVADVVEAAEGVANHAVVVAEEGMVATTAVQPHSRTAVQPQLLTSRTPNRRQPLGWLRSHHKGLIEVGKNQS
jgi:hypothetical protein